MLTELCCFKMARVLMFCVCERCLCSSMCSYSWSTHRHTIDEWGFIVAFKRAPVSCFWSLKFLNLLYVFSVFNCAVILSTTKIFVIFGVGEFKH